MLAVLPLPGTADPHEGRILWFSADGCVHWSGDGSSAEVFVAGTLIGRFTLRERGARNVLLLGLSDGPCMHLGHLARAFRVSDESLRLMRLQREAEGLAAVVARAPGGKEQKVQGDAPDHRAGPGGSTDQPGGDVEGVSGVADPGDARTLESGEWLQARC